MRLLQQLVSQNVLETKYQPLEQNLKQTKHLATMAKLLTAPKSVHSGS